MTVMVGLLSAALIAFMLHDAFEVMLLPRRVHRRGRFTELFFRTSWAGWSRLIARGGRREGILSHFGPLVMLGLFAAWAAALILGFGSLEWSLQDPALPSSSWGEQVYMSGVTFFTLGYGDVVPHSRAGRIVAVLEAGTGIGFIAVVIGYLPVLYQLFSRREAHVIQLDARAGSPPTAGVMLCRHAEADALDKLDELLREWEIWGSELLESHLSYPMLAYYRSQHDNQSWLAALAAITDCCALILVGVEALPPLQARMTFSMARQVVVEMAASFRIKPPRSHTLDRLPPAEYARLMAALKQAGVGWDGGPDAEATLSTLRATYEPLLAGLAAYLLLPLPGFMAPADAADNWGRGPRGLLAQRLVQQLAERGPATGEGRRRWSRLRQRLRLNP